MNAFIMRYITPITTGLFLISAISGIALFFHWAPGTFHAMHEWLSMVLLVPFIFHMWRNWGAFMGYVKRNTLWIPLILCIVVSIPFAFPSSQGRSGGNPAFQVIHEITQASISNIAPILKSSPEALLKKLQNMGYKATSTNETLDQIAIASGEQSLPLLIKLMPNSRGSGKGRQH